MVVTMEQILSNFKVIEIPKEQTHEWLLKKHYAHRIPSISYAFGLYDFDNVLQGVCTFGSPPSRSLVKGLLGGSYMEHILELNRLVINDNIPNSASYFVSRCLKLLPRPSIIVSYADTRQNHHGYIYQATNFIYTGLSAERNDWYIEGLEHLHSKSISDGETKQTLLNKYGDKLKYRERSRKHRYIYIVANRWERENIMKLLKYPIKEYPKGDNINYNASYRPTVQSIMIES
jgi:hypothetical protein